MTSERPYHLHCSIDADNPDEIARVLRDIAAEILIQRDTTPSDEREVMFEIAGGTYSNWYARIEHAIEPPIAREPTAQHNAAGRK